LPEISILNIIPPDSSYSYDKDELERLKKSIEENGLFHPIILQESDDPEENEAVPTLFKIVTGRARFLALALLGKTVIPATILPFDCKNPHEISLHENLRRNNLPWYDQVELEKELHDLKLAEYGKKPQGKSRHKYGSDEDLVSSGWSQNDTARELGISLGAFSQDMALATELARNPNLRNVKDKTTALKLIKQITKRHIAEIEQALPSEIEMDDVFLGDSAVILKNFKDMTFDCCITDPPWSEYKDEELRSDQLSLLPIFHELYRVLKRDSFLFIVTSTTDFYFYLKELPKLNFRVQSYPIIWQKPKTITHGRAPWQFARDYEPIIVAVKGNPSLTSGIELSSILKYDNLHYTKMIHPHEKPIDLITNLLRVSTNPGAKVIDVFAGSGVVLESCKKTDRRYIGIEKEKKFYDGIMKRLEKK
jgi:DNA modification methylase